MFGKDSKVKLCSIGLGGNSMEYGEGCHGSWYLFSPEDIAKHYADRLEEGVLLIDKRPAVEGEKCVNAFASPMCNVDMADGEIDRFGSRYVESDSIMLSAMRETAYGPILQAADIAAEVAPDLPGPLDYVPISQYVQWWRERGAIVYRYDGEKFVQV